MPRLLLTPLVASALILLTAASAMAETPSSSKGRSLTLEQAVDIARRKNFKLRASKLTIKAAKRGRSLAYGLLGPHFAASFDLSFLGGGSAFGSGSTSIDITDPTLGDQICAGVQLGTVGDCLNWLAANGEYVGLTIGTLFDFSQIGAIFNADTFRAGLGMVWPILNWKTIYGIKQAKVNVKLSKQSHKNDKQDVVTRVILTFYGVLAAQESAEIVVKTSKATKEHLRQAKALLAAGQGTSVDVLRWQARIAEDEQRVLEARQNVRSLTVQLANLLGLPLKTELSLVPPAVLRQAVLPRPRSKTEPKPSHPVLRMARLQVKARKVDRSASRAAFFPTIDVNAGYSWQHYLPHESAVSGIGWIGNWTVGISVKVPIFDSMTKVYDLQIKSLQLRKARVELRNARRALREQAIRADLDVMLSYKKIAVAKKQVKLAKAAHQSAERLYKAGNSRTTDVLDAQNALTMARFSLLNARYGYLMSLAKRDRALGTIE